MSQQFEMNQNVLKSEYAVRGELVIKAEQYKQQLQTDPTSLPFDKIIFCNIGNPQSLGQKPITFIRQVLSLVHYPELMSNPITAAAFPSDVITRAQQYIKEIGSTGSYSHSKGIKLCRDEIATFIHNRDGYSVNPEHLFLTNGASSAVSLALQIFITSEKDAVLTPIPQYPLYSATLQLLGGELLGYYLDEEHGWTLTVDELTKQYNDAKSRGITPKMLVIINPGNPTGQCLKYDTIKDIIQWCEKMNLIILADEVYQANIYSTTPFTSFFKVVNDLQSKVALVSFHSASKGVVGECGARGGYGHWYNFPQEVLDQVYKLSSISLCSNVTGQIVMALLCNPPKQNDPSYELYHNETTGQLESLKRRAIKLTTFLNQLEGVSCQPIEGAMYAFVNINLPQKALDEAKSLNKAGDVFYALRLLDETGIVCVPGTGFLQKEGTFHYRTTILPPESDMDVVMSKMSIFHAKFMEQYRD